MLTRWEKQAAGGGEGPGRAGTRCLVGCREPSAVLGCGQDPAPCSGGSFARRLWVLRSHGALPAPCEARAAHREGTGGPNPSPLGCKAQGWWGTPTAGMERWWGGCLHPGLLGPATPWGWQRGAALRPKAPGCCGWEDRVQTGCPWGHWGSMSPLPLGAMLEKTSVALWHHNICDRVRIRPREEHYYLDFLLPFLFLYPLKVLC